MGIRLGRQATMTPALLSIPVQSPAYVFDQVMSSGSIGGNVEMRYSAMAQTKAPNMKTPDKAIFLDRRTRRFHTIGIGRKSRVTSVAQFVAARAM